MDDRPARSSAGRLRATSGRSLVAALAGLALTAQVAAQQIEQGVAIVAEKIASRVDGFSYHADTSSDLEFRGTTIAPRVTGSVRVKTAVGRTELNARLEHLPDPAALGPFAAYVLWVITPEGRATNVGVFDSDGERGRIETATPLSAFALIVTAEPHFAVSVPGQYVIAQNVGTSVKGTPLSVTSLAARADYAGLPRAARDVHQPVPIELEMARYAVAIAQSAGAAQLATDAFERARQALHSSEEAFATHKSRDRGAVAEFARDAVQAAEDARAAAELRRGGAALVALRQQLASSEQATKDALAAGETARAETGVAREQTKALENRLPTAASRQHLASELLARWLPVETTDSGLVAHLATDEFVKAKVDLSAAARERLAIGVGMLLGIGGFSVTVSPALQLSEDVRQLGLAQQRARAVMDWLASLGLKASVGAPPSSSTVAEAALSAGPGVDLLIVTGEPVPAASGGVPAN
jgi:hypothetical protein